MSPEEQDALRGEALVAGYGSEPVLRGVDVGFKRGEAAALVGPNGAGKTTLFRVLVGQMTPERGRVRLNPGAGEQGEDITALGLAARARRGIGYLPQRPALLWDLSVRENLELALRSPAATAAKRQKESLSVGDVLARFALAELADRPAAHLSGGQARRLEIARLFAQGARFLLCDEPLAGLDAAHMRRVKSLLAEMASEGAGVLITDHRTEALRGLCRRWVIIDAGSVVCDRPAEKIWSDPAICDRYLGPSTAEVRGEEKT